MIKEISLQTRVLSIEDVSSLLRVDKNLAHVTLRQIFIVYIEINELFKTWTKNNSTKTTLATYYRTVEEITAIAYNEIYKYAKEIYKNAHYSSKVNQDIHVMHGIVNKVVDNLVQDLQY